MGHPVGVIGDLRIDVRVKERLFRISAIDSVSTRLTGLSRPKAASQKGSYQKGHYKKMEADESKIRITGPSRAYLGKRARPATP